MSFKPNNALIWCEIPVSDLDKAVTFYSKVFGYDLTIDTNGINPLAMLPTADGMGVAGHLYAGKPAASGSGPTVHLAVPDTLESAMAGWKDAGGTVLSEPIAIPPGRFAYGVDPDGNSVGMFEPAA
jgi:uncharacterized protein